MPTRFDLVPDRDDPEWHDITLAGADYQEQMRRWASVDMALTEMFRHRDIDGESDFGLIVESDRRWIPGPSPDGAARLFGLRPKMLSSDHPDLLRSNNQISRAQ